MRIRLASVTHEKLGLERRWGGIEYRHSATFRSKSDAKRLAGEIRKAGYLSRYTQSKQRGGWDVWMAVTGHSLRRGRK